MLVLLGVGVEPERLGAVVLPGAGPLEALARLEDELPALERRPGVVQRVLLELRVAVPRVLVDRGLNACSVGERLPHVELDPPEVVVARERHHRHLALVRGGSGERAGARLGRDPRGDEDGPVLREERAAVRGDRRGLHGVEDHLRARLAVDAEPGGAEARVDEVRLDEQRLVRQEVDADAGMELPVEVGVLGRRDQLPVREVDGERTLARPPIMRTRGRVRIVGIRVLHRSDRRPVEMDVMATAVHEDPHVAHVHFALAREVDGEAGLLLRPLLHPAGAGCQLDRPQLGRSGRGNGEPEQKAAQEGGVSHARRTLPKKRAVGKPKFTHPVRRHGARRRPTLASVHGSSASGRTWQSLRIRLPRPGVSGPPPPRSRPVLSPAAVLPARSRVPGAAAGSSARRPRSWPPAHRDPSDTPSS